MVEFNFTYDINVGVEQRIGFEMAAAIWSSVLTDDVEINLHIGATSGLDNNNAVGGAVPIFYQQHYGVFGEYYKQDATVSTDDETLSADEQALESLQEGNTVDLSVYGQVVHGNTDILLTSAQAKALGMDEILTLENGTTWDRDLVPATGLDGYIVVNSSYNWSYDYTRAGEAAEGTLDFLSMALHEIGHNLGFVSGLDGAIDVKQLFSGQVKVEDFTVLDLFRHTVDTAHIENEDGSVSSVGIGENAYFSIDGGVTNLGDFSTGKEGDGYQASHWKRLKEAMGIMDPTLAYKERLSLSELDLQAIDVLGWDVDYQSLNTALDLESLLLQAEQAVAEDFGLVSDAFTADRIEGNVYSLGYGQLWQLFEEQMLSLGYGQLWQAFELSYGQLWQEAVGSEEDMLELGYGQLWQELESHLFELGYGQLWQTFEEDMLELGYGQLWQTFELSYGQLWQQLDPHLDTLKKVNQAESENTDSIADAKNAATDSEDTESSVVATGGDADDILGGEQNKDLISGGAGDDLIDGKAGDDALVGGDGNDILYGFDGEDRLYGGTGDDFLAGEYDNDELHGEEGADILSGGYGNDILNGGAGRDLLKGDDGNDVLDGGNGDDDINGGNGQDIVIGGKGQDIVSGGRGDDIVYGDSHSSADSIGNSGLEAIAQQTEMSAQSESVLDFWVRLEAEDLKLKNFNIHEHSIASDNKLIATVGEGTASTKFSGPTGVYDIIVGYYDESDGNGELELSAGKSNNKTEVEWDLDRHLSNNFIGTNNFVTKTIRNVELVSGSEIELKGKAEGGEFIRIDYIDIVSTSLDNGKFYDGSLYIQSQSNTYSGRVAEAASLGGNIASVDDVAEKNWLKNTYGTTEGIIEIDARSSQFSMVLDEASIEANKTLRVEAEDFNLSSGYRVEKKGGAFSGGAVIADVGNAKATTTFEGESGVYDIFVSYLDEASGNSWARIKVNGETIDAWSFNANNGSTEYRSVGTQVSLDTGDEIEIQGWSSGSEKARIDYVDFVAYDPLAKEVTGEVDNTSASAGTATEITDGVMVATGNTIRVEAESMQLSGNASDLNDGFGSGGNFIKLDSDNHYDSQASTLFWGESGYYNVVLGYFDVEEGSAELRVSLNEETLDQWRLNQELGGDDEEPSMRNFTTRTVATAVYLEQGADVLRITGRKDDDDTGFVDYLQFIEVEPQAQPQPTTPVVIKPESDGSSDILRGGQGNDLLYGGEGDDIIYGEDEFDRSAGANNNDTLFGGSGNDRLFGNSGDDILYGDDETEASTSVNGIVRNGSQYLLSQAGSWEEAQAEAESLGGNLVTINDTDEAAWLKDTFLDGQALWIGYTDKASEGQWEWISGEDTSYSNWQPWQADGSGDYAAIADRHGRWDDQRGVEGWFNRGSYWAKNAENRGIIEIRQPEEKGGDDTLEGGRGNDTLKGGIGSDVLDGSNAIALGAHEQDILGGGLGADTFVLGSAAQSYYIVGGNNDYALIQDFDASSDVLQLHGSAGEYRRWQYQDDMYLYNGNDLVAVLENNRGLDLNSSSVTFV
ncbi:MAG: NF038122 family metalloprotease [Cyanobacteria bacterium J06623_4]